MVAFTTKSWDLTRAGEHLLRCLWMAKHEEEGEEVLARSEAWSHDAIEDLTHQGFIEPDNGGYRLTAAGERAAASVLRRLRLAERLLTDILQMPLHGLGVSACAFEHILHPAVEKRICTLLGHPTSCPHGHPIPPGDCCRQARASDLRLLVPLTEMHAQEEGQIAYLAATGEREVQKLTALGVLPGNPIRLLRRFPSYVFEMAHSQYAVDSELAAAIYVLVKEE